MTEITRVGKDETIEGRLEGINTVGYEFNGLKGLAIRTTLSIKDAEQKMSREVTFYGPVPVEYVGRTVTFRNILQARGNPEDERYVRRQELSTNSLADPRVPYKVSTKISAEGYDD